MDETLERLGETIASALAGSVVGHWVAHGELTLTATARDIVKVATFLRDDERCQFVSFIDITAIDWPSREQRFDVVYHLLSPKLNRRVRVKVEIGEDGDRGHGRLQFGDGRPGGVAGIALLGGPGVEGDGGGALGFGDQTGGDRSEEAVVDAPTELDGDGDGLGDGGLHRGGDHVGQQAAPHG